jgi:hypothetical protein
MNRNIQDKENIDPLTGRRPLRNTTERTRIPLQDITELATENRLSDHATSQSHNFYLMSDYRAVCLSPEPINKLPSLLGKKLRASSRFLKCRGVRLRMSTKRELFFVRNNFVNIYLLFLPTEGQLNSVE